MPCGIANLTYSWSHGCSFYVLPTRSSFFVHVQLQLLCSCPDPAFMFMSSSSFFCSCPAPAFFCSYSDPVFVLCPAPAFFCSYSDPVFCFMSSSSFYVLPPRSSFYVLVQLQLFVQASAFQRPSTNTIIKMQLCRKRLANTDDVVCITKAEAETKRMRNAELQLANKNIENACLRHENAKLVQGEGRIPLNP